jgi:hypothetical protein
MKKVLLLAVVAAIAATGAAAQATVTYDTTVTSPPGVFFGTGNANGGFTVDQENNVELGLSAHLAVISPILDPVSTDVYDVPEGQEPGTTQVRSAWNINYSINVAQTGSNSLSSYIAQLAVVDTTTNTAVTTWDVLGNSTTAETHVVDDAFSNATGSVIHSDNTGIHSGDVVAQNSENAEFFPGLNYNSGDDYTFTLSLFTNNNGVAGTALASDTIVVDAVATPLPSAAGMGLGMFGVIVAASLLRKKLRTA